MDFIAEVSQKCLVSYRFASMVASCIDFDRWTEEEMAPFLELHVNYLRDGFRHKFMSGSPAFNFGYITEIADRFAVHWYIVFLVYTFDCFVFTPFSFKYKLYFLEKILKHCAHIAQQCWK